MLCMKSLLSMLYEYTNIYIIILYRINKTEAPVLFCSGGTEPGDLVWTVPAWDWELRRGMPGDCRWPVNLNRERR